MLPSFIIIGTMKGGTTSLFEYLQSNPQIDGSVIKETDFFIEKKNFGNGPEWYSNLFPDNHRKTFEASPNYTKRHIYPGVPERLSALLPNIKLLYVVRDPIKRIISHYIHSVAAGHERREFSEAIKDRHSNYVQTSLYYYQLSPYLDLFGPDNIHVVQSEDLGNNPQLVLSKIARFLDIPNSFDKQAILQRHHSSGNKTRPISAELKLLSFSSRPMWRRLVQHTLRPLRQSIAYPKLSSNDRGLLKTHLESDINLFRQFTKMEFGDWTI